MLIVDIATLKEYVNNVNKNAALESFEGSLQNAEMLFIVPVIGLDLYTQLNTQIAGNNVNANNQKLLKVLLPALANLTMYCDLQTRIATVGNAGYVENSSEHTTQVRQWVHFGSCKMHYWLGENWLEQTLSFLEENISDFDIWKESEAYTDTRDTFFKSAKDFSKKVDIENSRRTFLSLKSWINTAEEIYIRPVITDELFDSLKTKNAANDLSEEETKLVDKIKFALAHWAMYESLPTLSYSKNGGYRAIQINDAITQAMTLTDTQKADAQKSHHKKAEAFTGQLISYLDKVSSDTVFSEYYTQKVQTGKNFKAKPVYKNGESKSFML